MASKISISAGCDGWWHDLDEERKLTAHRLCTQFLLSSVVTRLAKQRNVRIFFMHNKSQCCCADTTGTLLIICKSHVFHYKQATSGPMAMRLCADVHGNNWNIQPVLMILWGDIFVLWRTCFNFWWISARVLVFFGDYPPVIGPLPFLGGPPGEQF